MRKLNAHRDTLTAGAGNPKRAQNRQGYELAVEPFLSKQKSCWLASEVFVSGSSQGGGDLFETVSHATRTTCARRPLAPKKKVELAWS
jgi:hypothetical protein